MPEGRSAPAAQECVIVCSSRSGAGAHRRRARGCIARARANAPAAGRSAGRCPRSSPRAPARTAARRVRAESGAALPVLPRRKSASAAARFSSRNSPRPCSSSMTMIRSATAESRGRGGGLGAGRNRRRRNHARRLQQPDEQEPPHLLHRADDQFFRRHVAGHVEERLRPGAALRQQRRHASSRRAPSPGRRADMPRPASSLPCSPN